MNNFPIYKIINYDDDTEPFHEQIYIKKLQDHVCQYDFIDQSHSHDFHILVVCTQGSGKHYIDFKEYDFAPGKVFILKPGQIHHWNLSEDIEGYIVFFKSDFYFTIYPNVSFVDLPLLRNLANTSVLDVNDSQLKELTDCLTRALEIYQSTYHSKEILFASYLNIMIHLVHEWVDGVEIQKNNAKYFYLSQFETLLEDNYKKEHSVIYYAQHIGVSPEHLNRVCKHYLHKNAKKIIADRISLEAQRLLSKKSRTIQDISDELNFSDISNFVKFFKREAGVTPNNFRKRIF
jgi:AraC-like DNA-binding protein